MDMTRHWESASWQVRVVLAIGEERVDEGEVPRRVSQGREQY